MVDIHCHILPGIDDGAQDMEQSLELIRREVEGGTTHFVATPHVYTDQDIRNSPALTDRVAELQKRLDEEGIAAKVTQGAEVYPTIEIGPALDKGLALTVGGHKKHILIDLPMGSLPMNFGDILFEIQTRGVTPIIAHPERNGVFQRDLDQLRGYLNKGVVCQVNAGSLNGKYGETARDCALYILRRRWAHFLASDAHRPGTKPILQRGVKALEEEIDAEYLHVLTTQSGECIVSGQPLPKLQERVIEEPKGFLSKLFRRK